MLFLDATNNTVNKEDGGGEVNLYFDILSIFSSRSDLHEKGTIASRNKTRMSEDIAKFL